MLDHLDDLESDFSAIHRIDRMWELDGPKFFRLAYRMSAYRGVMRMRAEAEEYARDGGQPSDHGAAERPVRLDEAELRHSGEFAGLVEWGRG